MIGKARGKEPQIAEDVFIADSADVVGDVRIGRGASIWFTCVLRGDVMPIIVGEETNVQDGTVIHGTFNKCGAVLGNRVTIGHKAILHGCTIEDECLVGMGAIVMDEAHIGKQSVVGAGSLVTEGSKFPEKSLILGSPAKVKRPLKQEELDFLSQSADNYMLYKTWYEEKEQ